MYKQHGNAVSNKHMNSTYIHNINMIYNIYAARQRCQLHAPDEQHEQAHVLFEL